MCHCATFIVNVTGCSLKGRKAPGVDNTLAELLKCARMERVKALTTNRRKLWENKRCPKEWTQSHKKDAKQCQNHPTISQICHPGKAMLRDIQKRLTLFVQELVKEKQGHLKTRRKHG